MPATASGARRVAPPVEVRRADEARRVDGDPDVQRRRGMLRHDIAAASEFALEIQKPVTYHWNGRCLRGHLTNFRSSNRGRHILAVENHLELTISTSKIDVAILYYSTQGCGVI